MDWPKLLETILGSTVGTFTGGAIAVWTLTIQARQREREANQLWFRQTYLDEGLDRILASIMALRFHYLSAGFPTEVPPNTGSDFPSEAFARVQLLLGDDVLLRLVAALFLMQNDAHSLSRDDRQFASSIIVRAQSVLWALREALIGIKVTDRRVVHQVRSLSTVRDRMREINQVCDEIDADVQRIRAQRPAGQLQS